MATTSMPALALSGAAVSSTQPVATVSSLQAGTATAHAAEPRAARNDNDIDRFMERVLANRDAAPWRRLGDFVLRETWSFELDAPPDSRLSSFRRVREYEWYVREGTAVRSPVRVDGLGIDDATRRGYEASWLREEGRRRAELLTGDDARGTESQELVDPGDPEPRFVTDFFYFLEWTSEPGEYYFVGLETVAGRQVIRIEFYPAGRFWEEAGERINRGIVKTSMVTLWIDPEIHQIVKYSFGNAGLDFLRFRWLLRADGLQAVMELAPVRGVWMPARMTLSGRATTALGEYEATIAQKFFDYRRADTGARLADPESNR
ncbi:MAG: hypothetical protein OXQ28_03275 [Acidobacteriota bacterium]|nr:hypothetical protein [Acidobacteriota bacterium]